MRTILSKINGVTYNNAQSYIPKLKVNDELIAIKDKNNKFDPNAIIIKFEDKKLGYLPKDIAAELKNYSEHNLRVYVNKIVGGGSFNYGVRIRIQIFENSELKSHTLNLFDNILEDTIKTEFLNNRKVAIL